MESALNTADADLDLLRRYVDADDTEAFAQIVRRHTSLVYYTCLRVLGDRERAEDASQETFQRLMRQPESIHHSLSAWLHRVATRHSIDVLRSDAARRRRERNYQDGVERRRKPAEPWSDVSAQVDEALAKLDDEPRALLVEHFLRGRTQAEIAREMGVSKATLCRRMEAALGALRKRMGSPAALGTAALVSAWTQHAAAATVPETLTVELGKMALVSGSTYGTASTAATLKAWPFVALAGISGGAVIALAVLAVLAMNRKAPDTQASDLPSHLAPTPATVVSETAPTETSGMIVVSEPGRSLRSDHIVAFSVQGDHLTVVFGDNHVANMPLAEGRELIEAQAGATLEQLVARAP